MITSDRHPHPTAAVPSRRRFLAHAAAGVGVVAGAAVRGEEPGPAEQVVVGVMGLSRGKGLALEFAALPGVRVKWVCDVEARRVAQTAKELTAAGAAEPQTTGDWRRILDDPDVDALICAAPNHWHATATVRGCEAGKHVYVEKPCCQVPSEGAAMLSAARRHGRAVQVGTQRRSSAAIREAMRLLHDGEIGRVYAARAFYAAGRPSIGVGKPAPVPAEIDWGLWQGPAPRRDWIDNRVHYNWHWFWHWGNGELGNNGVHTIDLCRWGLGVDFPEAVTSAGGRYAFQDDQETPDTHVVSFQFPDRRLITWEGHSCNRLGEQDFISFYGEKGGLRLGDGGAFTLFDAAGKPLREAPGTRGDREHLLDFLAAIRSGRHEGLAAGIDTAWPSTLLCHLGNIAHRTGRALRCDPADGRPLGDAEAVALWSRDYEPGWELPG
ncbi:MAG: Gfo/Idh/MocA family protein [Planctomycetaceae bacterium]